MHLFACCYVVVDFDETTDVDHMSQGSFVLRYMDGSGGIHEVFVGFVRVEDATERGLAQLIKSTHRSRSLTGRLPGARPGDCPYFLIVFSSKFNVDRPIYLYGI